MVLAAVAGGGGAGGVEFGGAKKSLTLANNRGLNQSNTKRVNKVGLCAKDESTG